jgi:uncharacterized SAM-binding protein YcdF (DUF218 family)
MRIPGIRQIRRAATLGTAALGLACAVLLADGMRGAGKTADVGVVLGAKVFPNGRLSPRLASRLEAGIAAYEAGHVRNLLVSGATGKEGINEGEAMRDYLLWRGIPPEHVAMDPDGVDTGATACHAKAIMADRGWTTAAVVTSDYHVPRTKLALGWHRRPGRRVAGTSMPSPGKSWDTWRMRRRGIRASEHSGNITSPAIAGRAKERTRDQTDHIGIDEG